MQGDRKALARAITLVENDQEGYQEFLFAIPRENTVPVVGITGPPGAGKSTLINAVIRKLSAEGKDIAVVAVDPTSPFNYGSLLGDRLRMAEHFTNPSVFIRSLATRGSLGGLSEKIIEIVDVIRAAKFDMIIVETVGVGQSEVEIAGLADTTGIMEIADVFVVNKSDREGADQLQQNLRKLMSHPKNGNWNVPVIKCSATKNEGVEEIISKIREHQQSGSFSEKQAFLLTEKSLPTYSTEKNEGIHKKDLNEALAKAAPKPDFNLYRFADQFNKEKL